jgi:UDP-N-acetylglucosamine 2-epimerase (non-hydrolysing)
MKIAIVLGTRPEIIKMAPIIRELIKKNQNFFIIHTNQHYSKEMDAFIFKDLSLPTPRYNLEV